MIIQYWPSSLAGFFFTETLKLLNQKGDHDKNLQTCHEFSLHICSEMDQMLNNWHISLVKIIFIAWTHKNFHWHFSLDKSNMIKNSNGNCLQIFLNIPFASENSLVKNILKNSEYICKSP